MISCVFCVSMCLLYIFINSQVRIPSRVNVFISSYSNLMLLWLAIWLLSSLSSVTWFWNNEGASLALKIELLFCTQRMKFKLWILNKMIRTFLSIPNFQWIPLLSLSKICPYMFKLFVGSFVLVSAFTCAHMQVFSVLFCVYFLGKLIIP